MRKKWNKFTRNVLWDHVKQRYLIHESSLDVIWNCSIITCVIFELYEGKFSNSFIMHILFFSLCCCWIFRNDLDLNVYRWAFLSIKLWSSHFTYGASRPCNPVAPPFTPKSLNFKKNYMEISNTSSSLVVSPVCSVLFVFGSAPRSDKFLTSVDTTLWSVVEHLLPGDRDCMKFRIELWALECLLG